MLINEREIPHSHPIPTLNTRHKKNPDRLLLCFLHEQIHWFEDAHNAESAIALLKLRKEFPEIPKSPPFGAMAEDSSYLHLIVCWLELQAGKRYLGHERAYEVIEGMDVYPGIYQAVVKCEEGIAKILRPLGLVI